MLNVVLFGPPGAGKGTQAEKLEAKFGLLHVSTGEIIRSEIKERTELGIRAEKEMDGGKLASDELVISIISEFIKRNKDVKGIIFDGFPRTTNQAIEVDKMLQKRGDKVSVMISLDAPDEELIERLLNRGKVSGRADDQDINVIKNRITVYKAQTDVVKEFYQTQGKYVPIEGIGSIDEIFERISCVVQSVMEL